MGDARDRGRTPLSNTMSVKISCPENTRSMCFLRKQASTVEAASVQVHLARCAVCRAIVAELMAEGDNGSTLNDEPGVEGRGGDHTCEIEAPTPESATLGDVTDGSTPHIPPLLPFVLNQPVPSTAITRVKSRSPAPGVRRQDSRATERLP